MAAMPPRLAALVFAFLIPAAVALAQQKSPAGDWTGTIDVPGTPLEIHVSLLVREGKWQGTIDIPAQQAKGLPLDEITVAGSKIAFVIAAVPGKPSFRGELDDA